MRFLNKNIKTILKKLFKKFMKFNEKFKNFSI